MDAGTSTWACGMVASSTRRTFTSGSELIGVAADEPYDGTNEMTERAEATTEEDECFECWNRFVVRRVRHEVKAPVEPVVVFFRLPATRLTALPILSAVIGPWSWIAERSAPATAR